MAAALHDQLGVDATLHHGKRGEFTVRVDDRVVARKTFDGFPTEADCVAAVRGTMG